MLRTMDGRMEWSEGRERRIKLSVVSPELAAVAVALVVLLALVL